MSKITHILKTISFGLVIFIVVLLMSATVLEQFWGPEKVSTMIYTSPWAICLWTLMVVSSLLYLFKRKVQHNLTVFSLHISFVLILCGALVTHCFGQQGSVHLRQHGDALSHFVLKGADSVSVAFPFEVALDTFQLQFYEGTFSPMDFISKVTFYEDGKAVHRETISMNKIGNYHNYRFYQSGYDPDGEGSRLAVAYDPYGIGITYAGYLCLLLSMCAFLFQKKGAFRELLRHPLLKNKGMVLLFLLLPMSVQASRLPTTLSRTEAEAFGNLYVYYNDRICPMQTLAKDFTIKLCGKPSYKGLTAEQVLVGWFFYYDEWKNEPMIKVDDETAAHLLDIEGKWGKLTDFVDVRGYKLEEALRKSGQHNGVDRANEKFNLISMVSTGALLKIYPYKLPENQKSVWYSLADKLPTSIPSEQWMFIRKSMSLVAESVARGEHQEVVRYLSKIRKYQQKEADALPSDRVFSAEKIYNKMHYNKPLAICCVAIGLLTFVFYCRGFIRRRPYPRIHNLWVGLMVLLVSYLTIQLVLRGYVSGHLPLSDGFETMVFMSWCSGLLTLVFNRRLYMSMPFGFLLCGLSLMVAMIGEQNPQITNLMPVLKSPLLSIHVVVIMIAYSLLGFVMLNGLTALFLHYSGGKNDEKIEYLAVISRILLFPAVFLLTIGIFVGAVWANVSWGRYWGWDPKEVWALITMLIYALALHPASLSWFRRPVFFHYFCVLAFASVLFTYLGVNYILGGMHSYA